MRIKQKNSSQRKHQLEPKRKNSGVHETTSEEELEGAEDVLPGSDLKYAEELGNRSTLGRSR